MSPEQSLQFHIPPEFAQKHHDALITYLSDSRNLNTAVWQHLFQGINLLDVAQVSTPTITQNFRQVYGELIERPFANQYIQQLLETKNVMAESPALSANFARQIRPILQEAGFWRREVPSSILLQGYCLYWWQSFSRGYSFELFIMRDLAAGGIEFQMHDIRQPVERYSPADLIVLNLLGDIKTSIYFLQEPSANKLPNDFYITRLYEKGRERTLVVFQKPAAWEVIKGGATEPGTLETILELLPTPIEIEQRGIMLIVVEYETWKQMVRQKQSGKGS
ncbi:MAG: hypothetical protein H6657_14600 [Ardenticatenaceae bacterium]|nr:hypothetical protein [Ardenticatenaceae bacterium]